MGQWHVVMAVGISGGKSGPSVEVPQDSYTIMHLDLAFGEC